MSAEFKGHIEQMAWL